MIPAVLALLLFAVSAVSARRSVSFLGSAGANFWRQTLSVSLLCVLALGWGGGLTGPCLVWFFWSGVVGYGVGDTGVFLALPRLGSRLTSLMTQCLAAPIGVGIEWAWLGHSPGWAQSAAGMIILLGVAVALAPKRGESAILLWGRSGLIFGLIAAGGQAGGAVLSRYGFELARLEGTPANPLTVSFQRAIAGVLAAALWYWVALKKGELPPLRPGLAKGWQWVAGNAVAGPCFGVVCYQWALANHPIAEVLPIVAMAPLAVVPLAYWLEGERPTKQSLLGGMVAVMGVVALVRSR